MPRLRPFALVAVSLLLVATLFSLTSCSSNWPRRDPTGETFPTVTGNSLAGEPVTFPGEGKGAPLLLLIGYQQNTQFDLDRWIQGLDTAGAAVRAYELPTIPGLMPRMFSGTIDGGMRRGIPQEDWLAVVTLYADAAKVAAFTGNEDGLPGRIVLLDRDGVVAFFHDRGYSLGTLKKLLAVAAELQAQR
ncbi:MAG: hypothetical protein FJ265_05980 [Planctomycetes bacterium]|nr:hypothetical protein [Planctomycetota bacterium]